MSISRVPGPDNLYIGGIFTLNRRSTLKAANISHIVSVLRYDFKEYRDWQSFTHCSVQVDDVEDENLLGEFARTGKFIREGLETGAGVLVHCAMGRSRSVSVCIAYLLSTRPTMCPDVASALRLIRETRPMAEPNAGFMAQLELYQAMGCPEDIDSHPMYQRWLYKQEVEMSLSIGRAPDRLRFEDEDEKVSREGLLIEGQQPKELRCRKCRRNLATNQYLIPHEPKSSQDPTTSPTQALPLPPTATALTAQPCTHHFIQPLSWMRPTLEQGSLSGRLECPNDRCAQQVGRYAWQGLKCSCGHWVVPGFSLAAGKVDVFIDTGRSQAGLGVKMPPSSSLLNAAGGGNGKENL